MLHRPLIILTALLVLAACGSSPPVDFYALQPVKAAVPEPTADAATLGLGPFDVPAYLQRPQLVTRGEGSAMELDQFNRWVEPLENAIPRVLATNVDQSVASVIVVAFPWDSRIQPDYRLIGRINSFIVDANGEAILDVQWVLRDAEREELIGPRRDRYTAQAAPSGDAAAKIAALNDTIEQFSRVIAERIDALQNAQ